jgi:hypothetical protein
MLQGCHHEPFIRYAVVAIGALHKSLRTLSSTGREPSMNDTDPMAKLHREFAYLTYGKALKKMQQAIDSGADHGPRLALITCLLIVSFESHIGNRYKAVTHAKYGLQLLQQWTSQCKQISAQEEKSTAVSPKSNDVEDEIVEAFRNLDIQITTMKDDRKAEEHKQSMDQDLSIVKQMPNCFESLDLARKYWTIVMRRSCHFLATTWSQTRPELLTREFETKIPGSVLVQVGYNIHTTSFEVNDVVKTEQTRYAVEVSQWLQTFEPIFSQIRRTSNKGSREIVIASILQIHALAQKIVLAGVVFTQEILYDKYIPEFREIIRLSTDVAAACHSNKDTDFWAGSFLLDLGLVVPLFMLLLRCRDPGLRRQAIEILENWHLECWWDPLLILPLCQFIMEVEEESMVDGFIPEEARAILTAKRHCTPERGMLVQCVQRTGGPGWGLKWTERFVKW